MFANRIAVVTGGGSGIGRAVCRILAKENALVVIADVNMTWANQTKQIISDNSQSKHIAVEVNVTKSDSVKKLFKSINDNHNNSVATLLVNSGGIVGGRTLVNISEKDFDKVIDVNLKATFLTTQLACKLMVDHSQ